MSDLTGGRKRRLHLKGLGLRRIDFLEPDIVRAGKDVGPHIWQ
jgi:hypothetical protein